MPGRAEDTVPQRHHGRAPQRLRLGVDPRMRGAGQADLVLQPAVLAIGIGGSCRGVGADETQRPGHGEERDVAEIAGERRVPVRVGEHQELDGELDVDHASRIVLEVEAVARRRMSVAHPEAHLHHVPRQPGRIARQSQDRLAFGLERLADRRVPGDEAGARQRLVLPGPGLRVLVLPEARERGHHQPGRAVGSQPQVGVVELTRAGRAGQPGDDALRQARVALGSRVVARVVVDENDIEVRGVAQFLAAELAVADDREPRRRRIGAAHLRPDGLQRGVEDDVGQRRQVIGEALDREPAGDVLREQTKRLRVLEMSQRVHLAFLVADVMREACGKLAAPGAPVGFREQHARIEQLVEQDRVLHQEVGCPLRCSHQLREPGQQRRMLDHQRQVGAAAADRLQQCQQAQEDRLRRHAGHVLGRGHRRGGAASARRSAAATAPAAADTGCSCAPASASSRARRGRCNRPCASIARADS